MTARGVLALALLVACGGAPAPAPITATPAAPASPAPAVALGALVLVPAEAAAPFAVLDPDGTIHHARCALRLTEDGAVRDASGQPVVRLDGDSILAGDGRALYTLSGAALARGDGRAARLEGGTLTVEGSPALSLRVEGASTEVLGRTALLVFAALTTCD